MKPNVLLLVLDSVRARNMSLYGHESETTPFLEEFGHDATVFQQARAPGVRSLTSHTSLFTGLHVTEHGITEYNDKLAPGTTIWEELSNDGYKTGVFSSNQFITRESFGLSHAFDTVERGKRQGLPFPAAVNPKQYGGENETNYWQFVKDCTFSEYPVRSFVNGIGVKGQSTRLLPDWLTYDFDKSADVYTDLFLEWADEQTDPWAACVNLMDAHSPYLPDSEYNRWGFSGLFDLQEDIEDMTWEFVGGQRPKWQLKALEGLYDGTIRQMDAAIRRIVTTLKERGEYDDTLIVVTADHGEGFGEQSNVRPGMDVSGHAVGIHEALLHVPLMVKWPEQNDGLRVTDAASITQFPTAVQAARSGTATPADVFVPDGPVVASKQTLTDVMVNRGREHCSDVEQHAGSERAVYETEDDHVVKHVSVDAGDKNTTTENIVIEDPQTVYRDGSADPDIVADTFDKFEDASVSVESAGLDAVDDAVYEQLEYWGYV